MPQYILETDYYFDTRLWLKRFGIFAVGLMLILLWDFSDMPPYGQFAVYSGFILLSTMLFLSPVDDVAVDTDYFYHIKTSYLPIFSSEKRYKISELKSIRCLGVHVPGITMKEMTTRQYQRGNTNTIEMIFRDGSYKSLEVGVYKEELLEIIVKVQELLHKSPSKNT